MPENADTRNGILQRVPTSIWIIVSTILIIAVISVIVHMTRKPPPPPVEQPPVNVHVIPIRPEPDTADMMVLPAVVEPNRIVRVSAEVSGRIEKLTLDDGAPVRAGDVILELNTDLLKADHDRAVAQYNFDKSEVERIGKLLVGGAATERQRDETGSRLSISAATVAQMKAQLDRSSIRSPISGVINRVCVEKGEYVQPGTVIGDIVDSSVVKVAVDIPERDVQYVHLGEKAQVLVMLKGVERDFAGTVTFLSPLADSMTRASRCEVSVDNKDGFLRSGQIVRVRLIRHEVKDAIMVPLLAVIPLEEGKAVYVVEGDTARQRIVTLGFLRGRDVQITSGLAAGDHLIVAGHRFVGPGQKVKVVEDAAAKSALSTKSRD